MIKNNTVYMLKPIYVGYFHVFIFLKNSDWVKRTKPKMTQFKLKKWAVICKREFKSVAILLSNRMSSG